MSWLSKRSLTWGRRLAGIVLPVYGIGVSLLATEIDSVLTQISVFVVGVSVAGVVYHVDSERRYRQLNDEKVAVMLRDFVFPRVESVFRRNLSLSESVSVRVNVMMLRYRDFPPSGERKLPPWARSLKIDFSRGCYDKRHECSLKWTVGEGVCGAAISSNTMIATPLDLHDKEEWNMTTAQFNTTDHVASLISIPIYLPEDEQKITPVGVLNVDTCAEIERERLQQTAEELRDYASYVGMLV